MVVGSGLPVCAFRIAAFVEARAFGGLYRSSTCRCTSNPRAGRKPQQSGWIDCASDDGR